MGNRLPDPFIIFIVPALLVAALSALGVGLGAGVVLPASGEEVAVRSLRSGKGLLHILGSLIDNFVGLEPLGLVLTVTLGIGLAERWDC